MTVNTTNTETTTLADGVEVTFTYDFQTLASDWVKASTIDSEGSEITRTDITVVVNADQENNPGGTVTFSIAPAAGVTVRLYRQTPQTQLTDYTDYDAFPAESHEDALDKLTFIAQETDVDGGGGSSSEFFEVIWRHTTDEAQKFQYRGQYRDLLSSPVFYIEPINIPVTPAGINDRSIILATHDGPNAITYQFDFSRDGFLAIPALQVYTPGISNEASRFDLIDDAGTITATYQPVSDDKTLAHRFTCDSSTVTPLYAGFKTTGQGYGEDPIADEDFVTKFFWENNDPGQTGIVTLINETSAEEVKLNYDVIVGNVITMTPVDANKTTFYNFFVDTTLGSEIAIAFKSDGRIGVPTNPVDPEDVVTLDFYNNNAPGLVNSQLEGVSDFINQTSPTKKYSISVDDIVGGNTFSLFPNVNNSGILFQTRSSGGTNYNWALSNAGLTTLPGALVVPTDPTAGNEVGNRTYNDGRYATLSAANTWTGNNTYNNVITSANGIQTAAAGAKFFDSLAFAVVAWNNVSMFAGNATQSVMYWNGNARIRVNSTDISILGDDLNLNGNRIQNPGDPTTGTHVGDRDYNDARYVQQTDWETKIASIRYQNATAIGTQRGATASKGATGTWTVTLSSAASSADNINCQVSPVDGVVAHFSAGWTVNSSTSITITLRNSTTGALADGEFTLDVWDRG